MAPILEARGLTKRFKSTEALAGLDLTAERGQVSAILGPNGAGKTTFIRMVATLLLPDAGTLTVAGIDAIREPERVRRAIGLAGQSAAVEGAMSGRENLELIGRLLGHDPRQARASGQIVLDLLGLADSADRLVRTYSGGMRRKLDLGASLVGAPELLLLDEPTAGLDPAAATTSGTPSATWWRRAPTCCSPPSTWTRPTSWRPGSPSSTTARSSPRARPTS